MTTQFTRAASATPTKLAKGTFRCFHCRGVFQQKDGDWHPWNTMEVHLCRTCDVATKARPERRSR